MNTNPPLKKSLRRRIARRLALAIIPQPQTHVEWTGSYPDYRLALAECSGYDSNSIIEKLVSSTQNVIRGEAAYERDGVLFDEIEYSWPLLSSLLYVATCAQSLKVLDIGGSLGSTFRQNARFFDGIDCLKWTIVEQESVVEIGQKQFTTEVLTFCDNLSDEMLHTFDVALFGSSLCYLENPLAYLDRLSNSSLKFLIIERTPFFPLDHEAAAHRITKQTVHEEHHDDSYPCTVFSAPILLEYLSEHWEVKERWVCDLQPALNPIHLGYLLVRKAR